MAVFVKHTGCERCGSSDALAHYSDGSTYCFSCAIPGGASRPGFVRMDEDEEQVVPPSDLSLDFPIEVFQWIDPTGLKIDELIRNEYFFSKSAFCLARVFQQGPDQRLRGSVWKRCSAYEARYLYQHLRGPKSKFFGSKEETSGIAKAHGNLQLSDESSSCCIIVEDSLSAIKCARHYDAFPLFGSSISKNKLTWITQPYTKVYVWLDSDKLNSARKIADQLRMIGKQAEVIYTELDPKYCEVLDHVK